MWNKLAKSLEEIRTFNLFRKNKVIFFSNKIIRLVISLTKWTYLNELLHNYVSHALRLARNAISVESLVISLVHVKEE